MKPAKSELYAHFQYLVTFFGKTLELFILVNDKWQFATVETLFSEKIGQNIPKLFSFPARIKQNKTPKKEGLVAVMKGKNPLFLSRDAHCEQISICYQSTQMVNNCVMLLNSDFLTIRKAHNYGIPMRKKRFWHQKIREKSLFLKTAWNVPLLDCTGHMTDIPRALL